MSMSPDVVGPDKCLRCRIGRLTSRPADPDYLCLYHRSVVAGGDVTGTPDSGDEKEDQGDEEKSKHQIPPEPEVVYATVRKSVDDDWIDVKCRFADDQKLVVVVKVATGWDDLAHRIARFLTNRNLGKCVECGRLRFEWVLPSSKSRK